MQQKWLRGGSLIDHCSWTVIQHPELVLSLAQIMPDGHPPWHSMLRAWYAQNKKKGHNLSTMKHPQEKVMRLLKLPLDDLFQ